MGAVTTPPRTMCGDMTEAVTGVHAGGLCKWRGKTASARCILCYALTSATPVCARHARIRLRLQCIWLHKLLPTQCALLTCIPYLFPTLRALSDRKPPQFAIFPTPQSALGAQLLTRIELLLPLRLQIGLGLHVRLHLCGWRAAALPACTKLTLPNVAVDNRRRLAVWHHYALRCAGCGDMGLCHLRRSRPHHARCRHLRSCDLRCNNARR